MQFTIQELKMIDRLKKQERTWPRRRWGMLVAAAILIAAYGYILSQMIQMMRTGPFTDPPTSALLVSFFWPKCLLGFCIAGWLIGIVIRDWHGNVHRMLMLRLLDEQQKLKTDNQTK